MVTRAGGLLTNAPANIAAPPIVRPPSGLAFDMATGSKKGWPGSNNQFENFGADRDWANNFSDPQNSFAAIRNQFTWFAIQGFEGQWEPAGGDVNRIYRKGASGQDARTLVMECGPNPAAVPVGDKVVLFRSTSPGDIQGGSLNLSGYNLPLRQKMTCTASSGSAWGDGNGTRIIELDAGQALPGIDYYPAKYSGGWYEKSVLQHRHWSFYSNSAAKQLRHPLGLYTDIARNQVLANGGYFVSGGVQFQPTWTDWSREYRLMGASLIEELWRLECEGLANYYGDTDPRRMAVELENEPTSEWHDVGDGPGYGDLLPDVWHGIARQVWGPERTLIVKSSGFGGLNTLLNEFDFRCPAGDNSHLVIHNYDNQIQGPGGFYGWTDIGQTDWIAQQVRAKINELGYRGGGSTELGVDIGRSNGDYDRGQRLGRLLTSFTANDLYMFSWSMVGDAVRCSDIYSINGHSIEAYWPNVRPYARRAGIMTT